MPGTEQMRTLRTAREGSVDLRQRRAWFDEVSDRDGQQQGKGEGSKYDPATVEDARKIIEALQKRVAEREAAIEQMRASASAQSERIAAIEAANRKKLEEQGNYQELRAALQAEIEALKPAAERTATLEKIIRESNEARIARVPEQYRSVIPADYPPEKLQGWLNANEALLARPPAPNYDAGAGAGAGTRTTAQLTPEQRQIAKRLGLKDEEMLAEISKRAADQEEM